MKAGYRRSLKWDLKKVSESESLKSDLSILSTLIRIGVEKTSELKAPDVASSLDGPSNRTLIGDLWNMPWGRSFSDRF